MAKLKCIIAIDSRINEILQGIRETESFKVLSSGEREREYAFGRMCGLQNADVILENILRRNSGARRQNLKKDLSEIAINYSERCLQYRVYPSEVYFAGDHNQGFLRGQISNSPNSQNNPHFEFTSFPVEDYGPKFGNIHLPALQLEDNLLIISASEPIAQTFREKAERKGYEILRE